MWGLKYCNVRNTNLAKIESVQEKRKSQGLIQTKATRLRLSGKNCDRL